MYSLIKKILFLFDPETSHALALKSLQLAYKLNLIKFFSKKNSQPIQLMGLHFPNRIGLAAGLDKNADYIEALAALGFGFIEIGTVTPKPQSGNPRPRLFRLPKEEAIINRMGFNSKGADDVARKLATTTYRGILGINIGKNRDTPNEKAVDDYVFCMQTLWPFASYFTINISSPNTEGLRDLQLSAALTNLLGALKKEQANIFNRHKKYIPLTVKISPDLSSEELDTLANTLLQHKIDGVIATNTTIHRDGIEQSAYAAEIGGLSGNPLQLRSTQTINQLKIILQNKIPIIAAGGVMDKESAQEKIIAGAQLLQVYTGFIYHGPKIIEII